MSPKFRIQSASIAVLLIAILASGCRVRQLQMDQDRFRCALIQMQTSQIMDNLVRAYNGLPFVHLDYGAITGTVTQTANGQLSGSTENADGIVTQMLGFMFSGEQENQLT